jgi:hypothetical protein
MFYKCLLCEGFQIQPKTAAFFLGPKFGAIAILEGAVGVANSKIFLKKLQKFGKKSLKILRFLQISIHASSK